jgi:SWI/SNF-related matrix-associated actin-dependent regulator 1 of chromatin subfamily A
MIRTANLIKERQVIKICFSYSDKEAFRKIASFPDVKMKSDYWEGYITQKLIELLKELNFVFSPSLQNWDKKEDEVKKLSLNLNVEELYKYQIEGVHFLEQKNGRALIADEMGLGKTVQVLSWLKLHPEFSKVLVICPASLKINWQREAEKWALLDMEILNGTTPHKIKSNDVIINYDILSYWEKHLKLKQFDVIIFDEAHYIKNNKAKRTKAFKRLVKSVPRLIALTGTPIENKPIEIYNIVKVIDPSIFPDATDFAVEFCGAKKTRFGWDKNGATNTLKLNKILSNSIMIRRKKVDVLKDLPEKQIIKVPFEINNRIEYDQAETEFVEFLKKKFNTENLTEEILEELKQFAKRNDIEVSEELTTDEIRLIKEHKFERIASAPVLAQIELLKQLAVKGKIDQIIEWIENFLESGEKLVVFAVHKKVVSQLMEKFKHIAVKVDGSVSQKQRQEAVDKFQKDIKTRLFIGNIKAAGVGITLTAASNAAIIEFPWSPGELNQAADRIHRITQTKQVTIWNLVGESTIEEKIITLLKKKEKVITKILDGKQYEDQSILMDLFKSYLTIKT